MQLADRRTKAIVWTGLTSTRTVYTGGAAILLRMCALALLLLWLVKEISSSPGTGAEKQEAERASSKRAESKLQ